MAERVKFMFNHPNGGLASLPNSTASSKKTSEEHEEEHPNTSGAPRFSFNPIPHG